MSSSISFQDGKLVVPDHPIIPFIAGDGSGPDIWEATQKVIEAALSRAYGCKRSITWFELFAGKSAYEYEGTVLPRRTVDALRAYVIGIKGPLEAGVSDGLLSANTRLSRELRLHASVRPIKSIKGVPGPITHPEWIDVVVFRENLEDIPAGIEWCDGSPEALKVRQFLQNEMSQTIPEDSGISYKFFSREGSRRIMRSAMKYAIERKRRIVTIVHSGDIMQCTEGSFRQWCYELAREEFSGYFISGEELAGRETPAGRILLNDRLTGEMFQQMLLKPSDYDVIVTPKLSGDYLSDSITAQVGGAGMMPGARISRQTAVFEATHGTVSQFAGQDKANPCSLILSAALMLEYMGWQEAADRIVQALEKTFQAGQVTADLVGLMLGTKEVKTSQFAAAVISRMK